MWSFSTLSGNEVIINWVVFFTNLDQVLVILVTNKGLGQGFNVEVTKTKCIDMVGLILKKTKKKTSFKIHTF